MQLNNEQELIRFRKVFAKQHPFRRRISPSHMLQLKLRSDKAIQQLYFLRRTLAISRMATDATKKSVPSALTVGRIPISTCAQMYIGKVLPPPIVKKVTPKVSSEMVNTISAAAMIPGV